MQKNQSQKIKSDIVNRRRSLTRLMAVQIFYQFEFHKQEIPLIHIKNNTIEDYLFNDSQDLKSYRDKIDATFLDNLINAMVINVAEIDAEISPLLQNGWTLEKISRLMLQIIRFATLELKASLDVPFKVIINEYIEISSYFFEDSRVSFANSILENLTKKLRAAEFKKYHAAKNIAQKND